MNTLTSETSLEQISRKYERVLEEYPTEPNAQMALAEISLLRGQRLQAQLAYEGIVRIQNNGEAMAAHAALLLGHGLGSQAFDEIRNIDDPREVSLELHYLLAQLAEKVAGAGEYRIPAYVSEAEVERKKLRISLQRNLLLRELQESLQIGDRHSGQPLAIYRVEEAKKRLAELEKQQAFIEEFARAARERHLDQVRQNRIELDPGNDGKRHVAEPSPNGSAETEWNEPMEVRSGPEELAGELPTAEVQTPEETIENTIDLAVAPILEAELPPVAPGELGDDLQIVPIVQDADEVEFTIDIAYDEVDLSSIEDSMEMVQVVEPPPPVITEPVAAVEPTPMLPVVEPQTEASPIVPTPVSAPTIAAPPEVTETPTPPIPVNEPPRKRYDAIRKQLNEAIAVLARTRGVTSIHIMTSEGQVIEQTFDENLGPNRFSDFVLDGLSVLRSFSARPLYWVLECTGGIIVLQALNENHVLVTVGQTGANFGTLRYNMDKVKGQLNALLSDV